MTIYIFDGSFEGLLTSVFEYYERKSGAIQLVSREHFTPVFLEETLEITTDEIKAKRVWDGLKKKIGTDWQQRFYKAYLSEQAVAFQQLFDLTFIYSTIRRERNRILGIPRSLPFRSLKEV